MPEGVISNAESAAARLDMSLSDYTRMLLGLRLSANETDSGVIVVDRVTAMRIDRELNRWGNHYNQAVHALNVIAYYLRLNEMDAFDVLEQLSVAKGKLQAVSDGAAELRRETRFLTGRHVARIWVAPMPILKPISGHTSCRGPHRYLTKEGRALACDYINFSCELTHLRTARSIIE